MPKHSEVAVDQLVDSIDLPHKRHEGWQWMQKSPAPANESGFSRKRLMYYAEKLRDLGMSDVDIACMFSDLYWDAYTEAEKNDTFTKTQRA